jgi:hypothetical protein
MTDRFRRGAHAVGALLASFSLAAPYLAAQTASPVAKAAASANEYPGDTLADSGGNDLSLATARGRVATVLVCLSVECPISNEYLPTLNRLAEKYRPQAINFIGIDPNSRETLKEMADYARQTRLAFPLAKDAGGTVSRRLMFQVTPEVCVFDGKGKLAYRGRIDDRYRSGGSGEASVAELARALDEILAGKPVSVSRTKPVGCPIQLSG